VNLFDACLEATTAYPNCEAKDDEKMENKLIEIQMEFQSGDLQRSYLHEIQKQLGIKTAGLVKISRS